MTWRVVPSKRVWEIPASRSTRTWWEPWPARARARNNLVPTTAFIVAVAGGNALDGWQLGGAAVAVGALAAANVLSRRSDRAAAR